MFVGGHGHVQERRGVSLRLDQTLGWNLWKLICGTNPADTACLDKPRSEVRKPAEAFQPTRDGPLKDWESQTPDPHAGLSMLI